VRAWRSIGGTGNFTARVDAITAIESVRAHEAAHAKPYGRAIALWLLSCLILLLFIERAPVQRTQEARVLETAREMLGRGFGDWMLPKLNGQLRLRKPPVSYWLSGAMFELFRVGAGAGRIPAALSGWLTLGITYLCGAHFFTRRAGFLSAAMLLGSYLFYRFTRLAETDALASAAVTASIFCIWRGSEKSSRRAVWFNLSAVCAALAAMTKGPPALFPILFLIALSVIGKNRKLLADWILSGAPLTLALLALPWWLYAYFGPGARQITEEIQAIAGGEDHPAAFYAYFPQLLIAVAPFTGFVVYGLMVAVARWRLDPHLRTILIWSASILTQLLFMGNKQQHYLLPLMPPLMLVTGAVVDAGLSGAIPGRKGTLHIITAATATVLGGGGIGILIIERIQHRSFVFSIVGLGIVIVLMSIVIIAALRRSLSRAVEMLAVATCLIVPPALGIWVPSRFERDPSIEVTQLRQRFGTGPYFFYGGQLSLPMVFAMRQEIPIISSPTATTEVARQNPSAVLLVLEKEGREGTPPPSPFVNRAVIKTGDRVLRAYQIPPPATQP